mmetsp:Transcript_19082/g.34112  ORF Transcript_19082/g.34112 Transcript_19082/m.34112 type:complete len:91 (-) Transcript_19082:163-435(-)
MRQNSVIFFLCLPAELEAQQLRSSCVYCTYSKKQAFRGAGGKRRNRRCVHAYFRKEHAHIDIMQMDRKMKKKWSKRVSYRIYIYRACIYA